MRMDFLMSVMGWMGAILVLYAYIMLSVNRWKAENFNYQFYNILGALCLIINTAYNEAFPSTVVNIIWVFIALYSISKQALKKREINNQALQIKAARIKKNRRFFKKRA